MAEDGAELPISRLRRLAASVEAAKSVTCSASANTDGSQSCRRKGTGSSLVRLGQRSYCLLRKRFANQQWRPHYLSCLGLLGGRRLNGIRNVWLIALLRGLQPEDHRAFEPISLSPGDI